MSGARLLPDPAPDALAERAGVQAAARDLLEAVKREVAIYAPHQVETGFVAAQALQAVLEAAPDDQARRTAAHHALIKVLAVEAGGDRRRAAQLLAQSVTCLDALLSLAVQLTSQLHPSAKEAN